MGKLAVLLCSIVLALNAQADVIYLCIEPDGSKRFTNVKTEAKGCKVLETTPPNVVSSPRPAPGKSASPANFPKVDAQTQKDRDSDRRRILERELASEEDLLARARKELTEQEAVRLGSERNYQRVIERLEPYQKRVQLHESNIANLRKELSLLK